MYYSWPWADDRSWYPNIISSICILQTNLCIDIIDVPGATGDYDSNFEAKGLKAVDVLFSERGYDFGFVHIKAVDDAGHDRDVQLKLELLERFDDALKSVLKKLRDHTNEKVISF